MLDAVNPLLGELRSRFSFPWRVSYRGDNSLEQLPARQYPYGLCRVVVAPDSDYDWESLVGVTLSVWGPMYKLDEVKEKLLFVDGYRPGDNGKALSIIYYAWGHITFSVEPNVRMPDNSDVYHMRCPYRASYGEKARFDAMKGVIA